MRAAARFNVSNEHDEAGRPAGRSAREPGRGQQAARAPVTLAPSATARPSLALAPGRTSVPPPRVKEYGIYRAERRARDTNPPSLSTSRAAYPPLLHRSLSLRSVCSIVDRIAEIPRFLPPVPSSLPLFLPSRGSSVYHLLSAYIPLPGKREKRKDLFAPKRRRADD